MARVLLLVLILMIWYGGKVPSESFHRYTPPSWYETAWGLTWVYCTSTVRNKPAHQYKNIVWYAVEGEQFNFLFNRDTTDLLGMSWQNKIFVAQPYTNDAELVIHEIIHAQGIHISRDGSHLPIFDECFKCIKSVTANIQHGSPVRCTGNSDTLTKTE